jgi:hypothetical protein
MRQEIEIGAGRIRIRIDEMIDVITTIDAILRLYEISELCIAAGVEAVSSRPGRDYERMTRPRGGCVMERRCSFFATQHQHPDDVPRGAAHKKKMKGSRV